jgi:PAS domain S-box-containing protein
MRIGLTDISAHQRAEQTLLEHERQLAIFIEHSPAALAMFDREMRYLEVSRRWMVDYRLGDRNLRGLLHYDVFPEVPERWKAVHRRGIAGEVVREAGDRYERGDGSVQWLRWEVRPWYNTANAIGGIVIFSEDITERKRAEEDLRLTRFSVETASDALFWTTPDGRIVDVNEAACRSLGYTREELLRLSVPDVDVHYSAKLWPQHFGEIRQHGSVTFESEHRAKDGRVFAVEIVANYLEYDGQIRNCAMVRNISDRKQAETELRSAKEQLQATLDAVPDLLFEVGLDGRYYDYHSPRTELLAAPPDTLIGKTVSEVLPPDAAMVCLSALREAAKYGHSSGRQFALQLPLGERWFELSVSTKLGTAEHGKRFIVLSRDITERKQAEIESSEHAKQLQALSRRVLQAQEAERRRLAIELHDELGQALTAIKFNLQAQERFKDQTPAELNAENLAIVEDALQQVRRLALALRPSMLDDLGLVPALRWLAGQAEARGDVVVQLRASNFHSRLAPEIETACFRIVQESLTNIVRHAKARSVEIDLSQDAGTLEIRIQDDGCGFNPAAVREHARAGGSMGMLGMQERASLIGGQLDIQSAPGQGSKLSLRCPLRLNEELA